MSEVFFVLEEDHSPSGVKTSVMFEEFGVLRIVRDCKSISLSAKQFKEFCKQLGLVKIDPVLAADAEYVMTNDGTAEGDGYTYVIPDDDFIAAAK